MRRSLAVSTIVICIVCILSACGGSSGGGTTTPVPSPQQYELIHQSLELSGTIPVAAIGLASVQVDGVTATVEGQAWTVVLSDADPAGTMNVEYFVSGILTETHEVTVTRTRTVVSNP